MHLHHSILEQKFLGFLQMKETERFQDGQKESVPDMVQCTRSNANLAVRL